jgi:hypothetical protein
MWVIERLTGWLPLEREFGAFPGRAGQQVYPQNPMKPKVFPAFRLGGDRASLKSWRRRCDSLQSVCRLEPWRNFTFFICVEAQERRPRTNYVFYPSGNFSKMKICLAFEQAEFYENSRLSAPSALGADCRI